MKKILKCLLLCIFFFIVGCKKEDPKIISATLSEEKVDEIYYVGEFDFNDFVFDVEYDDGSANTVYLKETMLTKDDLALLEQEGTHDFKFTYRDFEFTFTVTIKVRYFTIRLYDYADQLLTTEEVKKGETYTFPDALDEKGYEFEYWSANGQYYNPGESLIVDQDIDVRPSFIKKMMDVDYYYKGKLVYRDIVGYAETCVLGDYYINSYTDPLLKDYDTSLFTYTIDGVTYNDKDNYLCQTEDTIIVEIEVNQFTSDSAFEFKKDYVVVGDNLKECYIITEIKTFYKNLLIPDSYNGLKVMGFADNLLDSYAFETIVIPNYYKGNIVNSNLNYLRYIEVINSEHYKTVDGVLYSQDLKNLILYPSMKVDYTYEVMEETRVLYKYAFHGNNYLTKVVLPEGLTKIDDCNFIACNALSVLYLPSSVNYIGIDCFMAHFNNIENAPALYEIFYGGTIDDWARINLNGLSPVTSETKFYFTIDGQYSLAAVDLVIHDGVSTINSYQFAGMSNIRSVYIPASVKEIGEKAFFDAVGIESFTVDSDNEDFKAVYNGAVLAKYKPGTVYEFIQGAPSAEPYELTIFADVKPYAFYNCDNITKVDFDLISHKVEEYAFYNCDGIESVNFTKAVQEIGYAAFMDCDGIVALDIYAPNWDGMGPYIFANCSRLESVSFSGNYVPDGVVKDCLNLKEVNLGNAQYIGREAFSGCGNLSIINFGSNLYEIGSSSFYGCDNLTEINIPGSVEFIGSWAFAFCSALSEVTFQPRFRSISVGEFAFKSCNSLKAITLPEELTVLNGGLFADCIHLEEVKFSTKLIKFGTAVFSRTRINKVIVPETVTMIEENAFEGVKFVLLSPKMKLDYLHYEAFDGSNTPFIYIAKGTDLTLAEEQYGYTHLFGSPNIIYFEDEVTLAELWINVIYTGVNETNFTYDDNFHYILNDNKAMITYYCGTSSLVTIPESVEINGVNYPVTAIGKKAFQGSGKTICLAKTIDTIYEVGLYRNNRVCLADKSQTINYVNDPDYSDAIIYNNEEFVLIDEILYHLSDYAKVVDYLGYSKEVTIPAEIVVNDKTYAVKTIALDNFSISAEGEKMSFEILIISEGVEGFVINTEDDPISIICKELYLPKSFNTAYLPNNLASKIYYYGDVIDDLLLNLSVGTIEDLGDFKYYITEEEVYVIDCLGNKDIYIIPNEIIVKGKSRKVTSCEYLPSNNKRIVFYTDEVYYGSRHNWMVEVESLEDFVCVDDCYYLIDNNEATLMLVHQFTNDMIIPETININGNNYPVTTISEKAFTFDTTTGASSSITIPASIKTIQITGHNYGTVYYNGSISDWLNVQQIDLKGSTVLGTITSVDAFYYLEDGEYKFLLDLFVENQNIGEYAFRGYDGLKSITIGSGVEIIGRNAFEFCLNVEKVALSEGLKRIEYLSLNCVNPRVIVLPSTLEFVDFFSITASKYVILSSHSMDDWDEKWYYGGDAFAIIK